MAHEIHIGYPFSAANARKLASLTFDVRRMRNLYLSILAVLASSTALSLTIWDGGQLEALKRSELILIGVATEMTIIQTAQRGTDVVFSHGRLKVQVKRVVIPSDAKVADTLEVDYGYNPGDYSWKGYKDKELVYVLRQKEKDAKDVITRAQALRFWYFAYRLEDLDRVLELRTQLQGGADPKSLTNNIPKEMQSSQ